MIQCEHLTKVFKKRGREVVALDDVGLGVEEQVREAVGARLDGCARGLEIGDVNYSA